MLARRTASAAPPAAARGCLCCADSRFALWAVWQDGGIMRWGSGNAMGTDL